MKDTAVAIKRQTCNTCHASHLERKQRWRLEHVSIVRWGGCVGRGGVGVGAGRVVFFDPTSLRMTGAASRQCHVNASQRIPPKACSFY